MYNVKNFNNGFTLVHAHIPTVRSVGIGVFVKVGSSAENEKNNGIAHFIEHMLFKGTSKRTAYQLVSDVEDIGAVTNASTSKEVTCYYTSSLSEHAERCCEILSDIFFNSVFLDEEMEKEKDVVLEEIAMLEDTPDDVCIELACSNFFADNAFGREILGTPETVKGIIKEDIQDFMSKHYTAGNTVLSIAGEVDFDDAVALAEKYFAYNFKNNDCYTVTLPPNKPTAKYVKKAKDIEQANVALLFPSIPYNHEGEYPMHVMNVVLGSSMSSRLFQSVREQNGYAYSIYSYPGAYTTDGYFIIYFGTSFDKVPDAIKLIRKELDDIIENGITDVELNRAKEQLKSSLVMNAESSLSVMRFIGRSYALKGEISEIDARLEKVMNVTKEDVSNIIKYVFDYEKMVISYVGRDRNEDFLEVFNGLYGDK